MSKAYLVNNIEPGNYVEPENYVVDEEKHSVDDEEKLWDTDTPIPGNLEPGKFEIFLYKIYIFILFYNYLWVICHDWSLHTLRRTTFNCPDSLYSYLIILSVFSALKQPRRPYGTPIGTESEGKSKGVQSVTRE